MHELPRLHRHALEAGDVELARLLEERLRPVRTRAAMSRRPPSGPSLCVERLARLLDLRR